MSDLVEPGPTARHIIPRERLEFVERLYLEGLAEHRIRSMVCERYDVTLRTARRYLARVRLRLSKLPAAQPEAVRARSEEMLLETYALAKSAVKYVTFQDGVGPATVKQTKAVPAPEVGTMANVAFRLVELHGAAKPQRVEHSGPGGGAIPIESASSTPDALHARLARLAAVATRGAHPVPTGAPAAGGAR